MIVVKACWAGSKVLEENPAWKLMRSSMRERDMTLAREAVEWLRKLPWTMHPQELCVRYPRVANRLALVWPDAELTDLYLKNLLTDKRGGRRGFSTRITDELMTLQSYYLELRGLASAHEAQKQFLLSELLSIRKRETSGEEVPCEVIETAQAA